MTRRDPGKSGKRIKLGGPFFRRNSKTLTAPSDTEEKQVDLQPKFGLINVFTTDRFHVSKPVKLLLVFLRPGFLDQFSANRVFAFAKTLSF